MSSTRPWPNKSKLNREVIEREKTKILRRYNRPWWRLIRRWDDKFNKGRDDG